MLKTLREVVKAIESKKGYDLVILDVSKVAGFTDYFVICTGTSSRQMQTVADEIEQKLGRMGIRPKHIEGYQVGEWILMDYIDFVVHIFSQRARAFYDLERLWRDGRRIEAQELVKARPPRPVQRRRKVTG